jgi:hypothetical protein
MQNGKANLVDMFVQSAKKHNINYGFYYSLNVRSAISTNVRPV